MASLLAVLAAVAALAAGAGWLAHRLRLPPALGFLAVGAIASPVVHATPSIDPSVLAPVAEVGILVFLFVLGLELDLKRLREALRAGALVLPLDVLVPGLVVAGAVRLAGWDLLQSIALGLCVGVSSTLFGERLTATGFAMEARKRTVGVLVAEDVAAVAMLAIMSLLGSGTASWLDPFTAIGKLAILFVALAAASLIVVPRLLDAVARTHAHDLVVLVGAATVACFGWLGAWAGSAELGALVAGVAAAEAGSRFVVRNALQGLRDLGVAVFFFASGLSVDVGQAAAHPVLVVGVALLFLASKLIVHVPAGLASGLTLLEAARSAVALGTVGEFSLILAAAAAASHVAHPLLQTAIVGAMLVLVILAPALLVALPALVRLAKRLPEGVRRPLWLAVQGARRTRPATQSREVRSAVRALVADLLLLAAWVVLAVAATPLVLERVPSQTVAPILLFSLAVVVAAPIAVAAYRRYRDLVHLVVRGEGGAVRARLVDAWVAVSAVLLFLPLAVLVPRTLPVLVGGLVVAVVVTAVAWRQLSRVQRALEGSVNRVLGHDPESAPLLDRLLERYPWGVRVSAVSVPSESPVAGRSVAETRLAELSGATLAVIQRHRREIVNPAPTELVRAGDTLVLMGDDHQLARAEALVVAHGEAIRLSAQSRLANLEEVIVGTASDLVGRPLGDADVATRTGSRVVGLWVQGAQHPEPFRDGLVPQAGDRLIVLGSPLQVQRARLLAEGVSG